MYRAVKRAAGGEGEPVSFADMLGLLGREGPQGEEAREALLQALGSSPFDAFFFECVPLPPPSVRAMQSVAFEFVLADAPPLQAIAHRYKSLPSWDVSITGWSCLDSDALLCAWCNCV
jgi:hypothetical protein